jgi:hypothetical protein
VPPILSLVMASGDLIGGGKGRRVRIKTSWAKKGCAYGGFNGVFDDIGNCACSFPRLPGDCSVVLEDR